MHKKILAVVVIAALAATVLGMVILRKDKAAAPALTKDLAPVAAPVTAMVAPQPEPAPAPEVAPVPAPANKQPTPAAAAPSAPVKAADVPPVKAPAVGKAAPPPVPPSAPAVTRPEPTDLGDFQTLIPEHKVFRLVQFAKLDKKQEDAARLYYDALALAMSNQHRLLTQMQVAVPAGMPSPAMQGMPMPKPLAVPIEERIKALEVGVDHFKKANELRKAFIATLTKEQAAKLKIFIDNNEV